MSDQAIILTAISEVRKELKAAMLAQSRSEMQEILLRLARLYALLDVDSLIESQNVSDCDMSKAA